MKREIIILSQSLCTVDVLLRRILTVYFIMESNGAKTSDIDLSVFISSGGMDEKKKSQVIGNLSCGTLH